MNNSPAGGGGGGGHYFKNKGLVITLKTIKDNLSDMFYVFYKQNSTLPEQFFYFKWPPKPRPLYPLLLPNAGVLALWVGALKSALFWIKIF